MYFCDVPQDPDSDEEEEKEERAIYNPLNLPLDPLGIFISH